MSAVSTADPQLQAAVQDCVRALRRIADYTLPPALDRQLRELGKQGVPQCGRARAAPRPGRIHRAAGYRETPGGTGPPTTPKLLRRRGGRVSVVSEALRTPPAGRRSLPEYHTLVMSGVPLA